MRDILKTEELEIPEGVEVTVKSRLITVTGPRGTLKKNLRHADVDIRLVKGKTQRVTLAVWQGGRKHVAVLRTLRSLINNMVIGVTKVCSKRILCLRPSSKLDCAAAGIPVQDACRVCAFPHQLYYSGERSEA